MKELDKQKEQFAKKLGSLVRDSMAEGLPPDAVVFSLQFAAMSVSMEIYLNANRQAKADKDAIQKAISEGPMILPGPISN